MIEADVQLYLVSRERLARLQKTVGFAAMPRVGEFVKLRNHDQGDYFAFSVVQVTHREGGPPEVWLRLMSSVDGRSVPDFIEDGELDEYVTGYGHEGWEFKSLAPSRTSGDGGA
ncbi:MAG: hypothetical protein K2X82_21465 [Gemmataceae bacterium]|nr:hypothetical protein [Gemmataceae bacterium]